MIKSLVTAATLTIALTGYALAQDTAPGSPAGTKPMTPEPMMHMHKVMRPMHHHPTHHPKHHTMAGPMASPTDAPK
jgi:hypothetical protein